MDRLKRFFTHAVEIAFGQLGLTARPIIEHVSTVLTTFARTDALYRSPRPGATPTDSVVLWLAGAAEPAVGSRSRAVESERRLQQHIGDYTLFMAGIFRPHSERQGYLGWYLQEGPRAYRRVAELDLRLYRPEFHVFAELADHFEWYAGALDYLRRSQFAGRRPPEVAPELWSRIAGWTRLAVSGN